MPAAAEPPPKLRRATPITQRADMLAANPAFRPIGVRLRGGRRALRSRTVVESCIVAAGFCLLYIATRSTNLSAAHDSISYLLNVERGDGLLHPHHLLYAPLSYALTRWLPAAWLPDAVLPLMTTVNALFGGATLGLVYGLLRRAAAMSRVAALAAVACVGFSFGWWYYSACVEVYVPAAFWAVATLALLAQGCRTIGRCVLLGVLGGCAALFHQTAALLAVPVLVVFWSQRRNRPLPLRYFIFAFTATLVAGVPYALAALASVHPYSLGGSLRWFTSYTHSGQWGHFDLSAPLRAVVGIGHALVGGHFLFAAPALRGPLEHILAGKHLDDELFLVRGLSPTTLNALCILSGVLTLLLGAVLLAALRGDRAQRGFVADPGVAMTASSLDGRRATRRRLTHGALALTITLGLFFLWWEPTNHEFWILPLVALTIALAPRISRARGGTGLLAAVATVALVVNAFGSIGPLTSRVNDQYQAGVAALRPALRDLPGRPLLIVPARWGWALYLERFAEVDVLPLTDLRSSADPADALQRIVAARINSGDAVLVLKESLAGGTTDPLRTWLRAATSGAAPLVAPPPAPRCLSVDASHPAARAADN